MIEHPTYEEIINSEIDSIQNCYNSPLHLNCETCDKKFCVKLVSVADFPSEFGTFQILAFVNNKDRKDHIMIVKGDIGVVVPIPKYPALERYSEEVAVKAVPSDA